MAPERRRTFLHAGVAADSEVFSGPDAVEAEAILAELSTLAKLYEQWKLAEQRRNELWIRGLEIGLTQARLAKHSGIKAASLSKNLTAWKKRRDSQ